MKRWQSILAAIALAAGMRAAEFVPSTAGTWKEFIQLALVVVSGYMANKNSKTNPDGTRAELPWIPRDNLGLPK